MFDVNHSVNDGGWTTTISGKMRTTYNQVFDILSKNDVLNDLIKNYQQKNKGAKLGDLDINEVATNEVNKAGEFASVSTPDRYIPVTTGGNIEISEEPAGNIDELFGE